MFSLLKIFDWLFAKFAILLKGLFLILRAFFIVQKMKRLLSSVQKIICY